MTTPLPAHAAQPIRRRLAALAHPVRPHVWRSALTLDLSKASFAVPVRVGVAVGGVLIVGGLLGLTDIAGFAALGALVAAFCRPDPYRVRSGRLAALGVGMVLATLVGAVIGVSGGALVTEIVVIALLAGAAAAFIASVRPAGCSRHWHRGCGATSSGPYATTTPPTPMRRRCSTNRSSPQWAASAKPRW